MVYGIHGMFSKHGMRSPVARAWRLFRLASGWWCTSPFGPFKLVEQNRSVTGFNRSYPFGRERLLHESMQELLGLASAGRLVKPKIQEYPLAQAAAAHAALESGETVGRLVLLP